MAHLEGFKPPTFWLEARHAVQLRHRCFNIYYTPNVPIYGGDVKIILKIKEGILDLSIEVTMYEN